MTTYGPYSPIKQAGKLYFISGQVGVNSESKATAQDIAEQTHQALQNFKTVLENKGLRLADVVKTTVFLKDMGDFGAMNEVYVTYFDEPRPARSCVAVAELPRVGGDTELLVEIEAIVYEEKPDHER